MPSVLEPWTTCKALNANPAIFWNSWSELLQAPDLKPNTLTQLAKWKKLILKMKNLRTLIFLKKRYLKQNMTTASLLTVIFQIQIYSK